MLLLRFFSLNEYPIDEIQVITYNDSIKNFCDRVGIKVVLRNLESDLSLNGLKNYRKMCRDMVAHMNNRDIIFCFYTFDVWSLYQLLLLRKTNRVYFYNTDYLLKPGYNEADSIKINPVFNLFAHWNKVTFRKRFFRSIVLFYLTQIWFDIYCFDGIYGHGLKLNISESDNALSLELARDVAHYFRVNADKASKIIMEVKTAVGKWRGVAKGFHLSTREQERMSAAFFDPPVSIRGPIKK